MEVASLAVGALALVGAFKDCIDLLSYIDTAKRFGHDYELSQTKLEVEKTIFLQWAERVGLLKVSYDPRLDNPNACKAIARILASIRLLLGESKGLQEHYGLLPMDDNEVTALDSGLSGRRMALFIREFEALKVRIIDKQEHISSKRKVRWAIRDKLKFDGLIRELSYFNSKLNEIMPDTRGLIPRLAAEDIEALRNLGSLRLVSEASAGRQAIVAELADMEIGRILEKRILQRLWFRTMDDRKDALKPAHLQTFSWALEPPQNGDPKWDDLKEWFRTGSGVYWLCGKVGSGKSTLMKHLYGNPKTSTLLEEWAGDSKLTLACFFFWALGNEEQKSQEGLMRALLFHVLEADPSLISDLLPKMWREAHGAEEKDLRPPTVPEMHQAFMRLGDSRKSDRSFCFFIDGLDEFSGNYFEGIEFINSLVGSTSVKVLVSSRPIPECVEAFSGRPKLRLQDLTRGDIAAYVEQTVGSHPYITSLLESEGEAAASILSEVVDKASGVFLWVVLACRSLLQGLAAFDYLSDLQIRVRELPRELEDLFRHMLGKIKPRYQGQAAKLLRVCYQGHLAEGTAPLEAEGLAILDERGMDVARSLDLQTIHSKNSPSLAVFEGRLRSRCCGLLEVRLRSTHSGSLDFVGLRSKACDSDVYRDLYLDREVDFIHRSVFDFLKMPGVWDLDCLQVQDDLFEPNAILACLSLHVAHLNLLGDSRWTGELIKDVLLYARQADSGPSSAVVAPVLLKLEDMLQNFTPLADLPRMDIYPPWPESSDRPYIGLLLAMEAGMVNFVRSYAKLRGFTTPGDRQSLPLLYHALCQPLLKALCHLPFKPSLVMLEDVLTLGPGPDGAFRCPDGYSITPAETWIGVVMETPEKYLGAPDCAESALLVARITEVLLEYGAESGSWDGWANPAFGDWVERMLVHFTKDTPLPPPTPEFPRHSENWPEDASIY